MSEDGWYYAHNGQSVGPVDLQQLRSVISNGAIPADSLVWRDGFQQWIPARTVPELASGYATAASVAPAAVQSRPYVMGYAQPQTGFAYAGFWKRFAALFIDWLIMLIPNIVIGFVVGFILFGVGALDDGTSGGAIDLIGNLIAILVGWLYFALMESSKYQGTLGKLALGIKVTDEAGQAISFGKATGRHFGKIISALILGIGYLMVAFTSKKQGLHDIMAGCLVVNRK